MTVRYFTFSRAAIAAKKLGQKLRFTKGKGYWLSGKPKPVSAQTGEITMFDSVNPSEIPGHARAVAGYVGGYWPTFAKLGSLFPASHRLSIAVNAGEDAECLDVEKGDATNEQAPAWVRRQLKRGIRRPVVYTSVSNAPALIAALERNGVHRAQYRLWTAHYTYKPHRCGPACGYGQVYADATQFSDHALGKNLDASLCSPSFFQV